MSSDRPVAIVTGAGQGIGRGIAEALGDEGHRVIVAEKNAEMGEQTAAAMNRAGDGRASFVRTDVTDQASIAGLIEAVQRDFGRLDVLVNNAGTNFFMDPLSTTLDDWQRCMDLNLRSVWLTIKHGVPLMKSGGGGAVVNIASTHAFQTSSGSFPYAASKAGVVGLTRVLALDLAADGIRVNAVCPGWIETPLAESYLQAQPDPEATRRQVVANQPLGRLGTPHDVGWAVAFLASPKAGFITGTTLMVDGGATARG